MNGRDDKQQWTQHELRRAVTLSCADALRATKQIGDRQREAIAAVLERVIADEPMTVQEEMRLLNVLMDAGCDLHLPLEETAFGRLLAERDATDSV
jgi:hypothetical protein